MSAPQSRLVHTTMRTKRLFRIVLLLIASIGLLVRHCLGTDSRRPALEAPPRSHRGPARPSHLRTFASRAASGARSWTAIRRSSRSRCRPRRGRRTSSSSCSTIGVRPVFATFGGGVPTPELDKLAGEGLRYNRFHTTAMCGPTRAADHRPQPPHRRRRASSPRRRPATTATPASSRSTARSARFSANGYITSWFGKNHNTPDWETSPAGPFDRWANGLGFDYFYGFIAGEPTSVPGPLREPQPRPQDARTRTII